MLQQLGLHHIRTKLYSLPLSSLNNLLDESSPHITKDYNTLEYKLTAIIMDIANNRLFKPVCLDANNNNEVRHFFKVHFRNKGIDAIKISNILNNKHVKAKIPVYFKNTSTPVISYTYNKPIASKIFNYRQSLQCFNIVQCLLSFIVLLGTS